MTPATARAVPMRPDTSRQDPPARSTATRPVPPVRDAPPEAKDTREAPPAKPAGEDAAHNQPDDVALLRRVIAAFPFATYAQLAEIAVQRPERGDTGADPEPSGEERLGPRTRRALRPADGARPGPAAGAPVSRFLAHAASLDRPVAAGPLGDPWASTGFALAYAREGAGALRGTAPLGAALASALNEDATEPWSGAPRMSRAMAAAARQAAPSLAATGSDAAVATWWIHAYAGEKPIAGCLTPSWLVERLVAVPPAGQGAPFPLGAALLEMHRGSTAYRSAYQLDRVGDRVAFVFDLLLHVFDTPTRRLCFNREALGWFAAPCPGLPGNASRFEVLLGLAAGRGVPADTAGADALAQWFRAQACRAFPAFGRFASISEAVWCAADRKLELVGLASSSTGLGQNAAMSAAALTRAGVPYRVRDSELGFAEAPAPFRGAPLRLDPPGPLAHGTLTGSALPFACAEASAALPLAGASAVPPLAVPGEQGLSARLGTAAPDDHLAPAMRPKRKALLLHLNADEAPQALCNPLFDRHEDLYAIAFLLWELDVIPAAHRLCLDLVDEIWCPSRYVAEIYSPHTAARVTTVGKGIALPAPLPPKRARFGIPEGAFVFLVSFDFHSSVERKNPLAAVHAFRRAFDGAWGDRAVRLVIKTTPPVRDHWGDPNGMWPAILAAAEADPRILIVADHLPFPELIGLIADANCLVSPHRAEGFGYMPAYALALGRPVIGTDYSGPRDFLTEETGYPVPWQPRGVAAGESILPVEGAHWADVDVEAMAQAMRRVRNRPGEAKRRAAAGQELMRQHYSIQACAARYRAALQASGVI
ncbi:MAG: glycosyltransferase [Pseudomonadota bacterium]